MFEENKMSTLHFGNLSEDTTSQLDKKKCVEPSDWTKNLEKYIPGAHCNPQTNSAMSNDLQMKLHPWEQCSLEVKRFRIYLCEKFWFCACMCVGFFFFFFPLTPFICVKGKLLKRIIRHKRALWEKLPRKTDSYDRWQEVDSSIRNCLHRRHKTISHI